MHQTISFVDMSTVGRFSNSPLPPPTPCSVLQCMARFLHPSTVSTCHPLLPPPPEFPSPLPAHPTPHHMPSQAMPHSTLPHTNCCFLFFLLSLCFVSHSFARPNLCAALCMPKQWQDVESRFLLFRISTQEMWQSFARAGSAKCLIARRSFYFEGVLYDRVCVCIYAISRATFRS